MRISKCWAETGLIHLCGFKKNNKLKRARSGTLSVAVARKIPTFLSILFTVTMGNDRHQVGNSKDLP